MSEPATVRTTSVVTGRGLEITIPTPNMISGVAGLMVLFGFIALLFVGVSDVLLDGGEGWLRTIDELFGWEWLALGAVITVLSFRFVRRGNEHLVLGTRTFRRQQRLGRIVIEDTTYPLARVSDVVAHRNSEGHWTVRWRVGGSRLHRYAHGKLQAEDAEAVAARMRDWIAAPGHLPVEHGERVPPLIGAAEAAVSVVSSRIRLVVPLLLGTGGLLLLAFGWQLHEAQQGRAAPLPRLDQVADGTLARYRWVVSAPPGQDAIHGRVYLQVAVEYTAADGVPRTLWLRSRQAPELFRLRHGHLQRASALLGTPHFEFHVPAWSAAPFSDGESWAEWLALEHDQSGNRPIDSAYGAARLLNALDEPFHYLATLWTAPAADWRVAYNQRAPDRAMLLSWVAAEQAALQQVSLARLWPAGALALLLVFWTLPALVPFTAGRRWVARLVVLGVVAALPLWADAADRLPRLIGAHDLLLDVVGDIARMGGPEPFGGHAYLVRARAPGGSVERVALEWTPARSAAADLLRELRLHEPPAQLPLADSAAATQYMIARVDAALRALDDDRLAAFGRRYADAQWRLRVDALHVAVIGPVLCGLHADSARAEPVRQQLARAARCGQEQAARALPRAGTRVLAERGGQPPLDPRVRHTEAVPLRIALRAAAR